MQTGGSKLRCFLRRKEERLLYGLGRGEER